MQNSNSVHSENDSVVCGQPAALPVHPAVREAHTPGPWTWDGDVTHYDADIEAPWLLGPDRGAAPVLSGEIHGYSKADARLIAAAPDLLAALINMRWAAGERDAKNRIRQFDQFMDEAAAAIAKATGGAA